MQNGGEQVSVPLPALPQIEDGREAWVAWLATHLQRTWPAATVRADASRFDRPGTRRGITPDVEFWYPNAAGVRQLLHLYRILPAGDHPGWESLDAHALDELAALLAYCRTNGRQLTLVVPDRSLNREEIEALDAALEGTLSPMLFEVPSYQIE